jgi:RimJ/RimL family protein N-acetyltransferase
MIVTERLLIRPLSYYELVSRVYSHSGKVMSTEKEERVVKDTLVPMSKAPEKDHPYYTFWVGYDKGEEVIEIGFLRPPDLHKGVEIWYYVKNGFMNNGYATEAVKGMVKWTGSKDIIFVCASVDVDNTASKKVLLKSGFTFHSIMKDGMEAYFKMNSELFN